MARLTRRSLLAGGAAATGMALAGCIGGDSDRWAIDGVLAADSVTQYQGPSCDCCDDYADYVDPYVEGGLEVTIVDDLGGTKRSLGVPPDAESCHTLVVDDYVVEGHVPLEFVEDLLAARPDAVGIALPDMPTGSPGMGGIKFGEWTIHEIDHDGTLTTFATV